MSELLVSVYTSTRVKSVILLNLSSFQQCARRMLPEIDDVEVNIDNLEEKMAGDYDNLLRVLSTLKFIRDTDNSSDLYLILENLVYDALCHMNQALGTLGLDIPSQSEITQTTNTCHTEHNLLSEYIRNLEIFRQLKRIANGLFDKYNNYGQITT